MIYYTNAAPPEWVDTLFSWFISIKPRCRFDTSPYIHSNLLMFYYIGTSLFVIIDASIRSHSSVQPHSLSMVILNKLCPKTFLVGLNFSHTKGNSATQVGSLQVLLNGINLHIVWKNKLGYISIKINTFETLEEVSDRYVRQQCRSPGDEGTTTVNLKYFENLSLYLWKIHISMVVTISNRVTPV